ncbi:hypothetical protein [Agromyces laixinhei]|nr:hypothetical protein [Agromyces laixinhei]
MHVMTSVVAVMIDDEEDSATSPLQTEHIPLRQAASGGDITIRPSIE